MSENKNPHHIARQSSRRVLDDIARLILRYYPIQWRQIRSDDEEWNTLLQVVAIRVLGMSSGNLSRIIEAEFHEADCSEDETTLLLSTGLLDEESDYDKFVLLGGRALLHHILELLAMEYDEAAMAEFHYGVQEMIYSDPETS